MPTYQFECQADTKHPLQEGWFSMTEAPNTVPCCVEGCPGQAQRLIGAGGGVILKGSFPGQDSRRENEDDDVKRRAQYARRLKAHGVVPIGAQIKMKDVDVDNPRVRNLPKADKPTKIIHD